MLKKALEIKVSERLKELLCLEMNKSQLGKHYYNRMRIIYNSCLGYSNYYIASITGITIRTVRKWRKRWRERQDYILEFEQMGHPGKCSDLDLIREVKLLLSDLPRTGSTSRITGSEKIRLQALACEPPEDYGLPFTNWAHIELSKQAGKMGIKISSSYYGKLLKKRFTSA